MENTMNTSEKVGELAGALAKAQLQFLPVLKDSDNPYFHSKYADLATVINATQKALATNGLVVVQSPIVDTEAEKAGVVTVLAHSSGEWLSHELMLPATMKSKDGVMKFDAQSVGSAITYARRYSYQAIVGVAAEVDDDGNAAVNTQREKQAAKPSTLHDTAGAAKGGETVTLTPYKEGFVALSGTGLPIVRAAVDNKILAELGFRWEGRVCMILAAKGFEFVDLCAKHNVGTHWEDPPQRTSGDSGLPKANIPPFVPSGENGEQSTDPIILSAERVASRKPGGNEFLKVNWGGKQASCFDKKLWPHLEHYVNRPAMLVLETKGQYTNLVGIERLDGEEFLAERV